MPPCGQPKRRTPSPTSHPCEQALQRDQPSATTRRRDSPCDALPGRPRPHELLRPPAPASLQRRRSCTRNSGGKASPTIADYSTMPGPAAGGRACSTGPLPWSDLPLAGVGSGRSRSVAWAAVYLDAATAVPLHPVARPGAAAPRSTDGWADPAKLYAPARRAAAAARRAPGRRSPRCSAPARTSWPSPPAAPQAAHAGGARRPGRAPPRRRQVRALRGRALGACCTPPSGTSRPVARRSRAGGPVGRVDLGRLVAGGARRRAWRWPR